MFAVCCNGNCLYQDLSVATSSKEEEYIDDGYRMQYSDRGNGARYKYKAWLMRLPATVETEIHDYVETSGWKGVSKYYTLHTQGEYG